MLKTYGRMTSDKINSKGSNKKNNIIFVVLFCLSFDEFIIYFTYNEHENLRLEHIIICHFCTKKIEKKTHFVTYGTRSKII